MDISRSSTEQQGYTNGLASNTMDLYDVETGQREALIPNNRSSSVSSSLASSPTAVLPERTTHPSDHIQFPLGSSSRSSQSPTPSSNLAVATAALSATPVVSYAPEKFTTTNRDYQFITGGVPLHTFEAAPQANENFRKLKQKKENKEKKKKDKNVKETYTSAGSKENFNVDKILESLGEINLSTEKSQKKSQKSNKSGNAQTNGSGGSASVKKDPKKDPRAAKKVDIGKRDHSADSALVTTRLPNDVDQGADYDAPTVQDVGDFRNAVLIQGDLKRPASRSTENLTAFTKVTKKQKWKKKSSTDEQQTVSVPSSSSSSLVASNKTSSFRSRTYKLPQRGGPRNQQQNEIKQQQDPDAVSSPTSESASVTSGGGGDLDLAADFPPLDAVPLASPPPSGWPAVRANVPHSLSSPSDLSAVISSNANRASDSYDSNIPSNVHSKAASSYSSALANPPPPPPRSIDFRSSNPPDVTVETGGTMTAEMMMPDVTAQLPHLPHQSDAASSLSNSGRDSPLPAVDDTAPSCPYLEQVPAVTIFGRETPVEDLEFGGPINEDLLSMGPVAVSSEPQESLHQMDDAIVSFGSCVEDVQLHISPEAEPDRRHDDDEQQHNDETSTVAVILTATANASAGVNDVDRKDGGQGINDDRDSSDLPAPQEESKASSKPNFSNGYNYQQIVSFVANEWKEVQNSSGIKYYKPSNKI